MSADLSRLHYLLIDGLIGRGSCPTTSDLALQMGSTEDRIRGLLRDLAGIHGIVLHPHVSEPWIIHPFSLTPTVNWVEGRTGSWWAPCLWCAFGIATLAGGGTRIHSRFGAEAEPLVLEAKDGEPMPGPDVWVHFAVPPRRAWDNVHRHCSLLLPFHSPAQIQNWCERHGIAMGEAVPLQQVARLARLWYGRHRDPHWTKWTVDQAGEIFTQAGLTSDFWRLEQREGEF